MPSNEHTSVELTGTDRPGLLSEICAVLANSKCNVVEAELWTHNTRVAAVVRVTDESTRRAVEDPEKLSMIKELLCNVLKGDDASRTASMTVSTGHTHTERRLHQMMFSNRDYERNGAAEGDDKSWPQVAVMDCSEKDYSVVIMRSKDRPKLLFDTLCTLTDMQYVVHHGTVEAGEEEAYQGLELVLRTEDRIGLLSDITRIFRENGLTITRAEISTEDGEAFDTFFLSDMSGNPVEAKTIDSIRRQLGRMIVRLKQNPLLPSKPPEVAGAAGFLFGNLFKASFQSLWLQTNTGKKVGFDPVFEVEVRNQCRCTVRSVFLQSEGFASSMMVDPKLFRREGASYLVNDGKGIPSSDSVKFCYAWDRAFTMSPASFQLGCW
ncbi:hypothetical protein B296_00053195 [Ensete ventricosum]|uniref:ACT domain-containing protein ACR n=1 Tax=Ensete ventricosum TaxID=4639 RepID=A0A426Y9C5_ENSVE|nr:hypothetical protein B296_00053195 [Ensete ventricosum]